MQASGLGNRVGNAIIADHREDLVRTIYTGRLMGDPVCPDVLKPMGISQYRLAKEIGVPAQRIGDIVAGKRSITADTDLRLCRFFALSDGYWLRGQARYDTEVAKDALQAKLAKIKPWGGMKAHAGSQA